MCVCCGRVVVCVLCEGGGVCVVGGWWCVCGDMQ